MPDSEARTRCIGIIVEGTCPLLAVSLFPRTLVISITCLVAGSCRDYPEDSSSLTAYLTSIPLCGTSGSSSGELCDMTTPSRVITVRRGSSQASSPKSTLPSDIIHRGAQSQEIPKQQQLHCSLLRVHGMSSSCRSNVELCTVDDSSTSPCQKERIL